MTVPIPSQVASSPVFNDTQFADASGNPLAGGKIFTYESGSNSAQQITFTSAQGDTANTNPIVLDSQGRMTTEMWLAAGVAYNLVLTQADETTVIKTFDNVRGSMPIPVGGGLPTALWTPASVVPVYVSSTQFTLEGFFIQEFALGNRIRYQFTDQSYGYGTVTNIEFIGVNTEITQVTFRPDSGGFTNAVINVAYSQITTQGKTADAGAITYVNSIGYDTPTVGSELQDLTLRISSLSTVYSTVGSSPNFSIYTNWPVSSLEQATYMVKFTSPGVNANLNINNIGAIPLMQIDAGGNKIPARIVGNMVTQIAYDGTDLVVLNPVPSIPSGTILFFPTTTAPAGWRICDGSSVDANTEPALYAVVGANVPDMRGKFPRGLDLGAGIDPGRTVLSTQQGQMESHNHRMVWDFYDGGGGRGLIDPVNPVDITYPGQTGGNASWGVTFAGSGTETRPINIAVLPCIKI